MSDAPPPCPHSGVPPGAAEQRPGTSELVKERGLDPKAVKEFLATIQRADRLGPDFLSDVRNANNGRNGWMLSLRVQQQHSKLNTFYRTLYRTSIEPTTVGQLSNPLSNPHTYHFCPTIQVLLSNHADPCCICPTPCVQHPICPTLPACNPGQIAQPPPEWDWGPESQQLVGTGGDRRTQARRAITDRGLSTHKWIETRGDRRDLPRRHEHDPQRFFGDVRRAPALVAAAAA